MQSDAIIFFLSRLSTVSASSLHGPLSTTRESESKTSTPLHDPQYPAHFNLHIFHSVPLCRLRPWFSGRGLGRDLRVFAACHISWNAPLTWQPAYRTNCRHM
ncbi:hypothetical protein BC834DRAFT_879326 [Gloeopeniophorella convolvens]|nr:hypothetical protein BC834DRAFT_879326 [Gloeopeniophorella convolvens]